MPESPLAMHDVLLISGGCQNDGLSSGKGKEPIMTAYECKTCGKVTTDKGHLCEPSEVGKIYTCEHCGKQVSNEKHVCKPLVMEFKFFCNDCGRSAVSEKDVCNPAPIKE